MTDDLDRQMNAALREALGVVPRSTPGPPGGPGGRPGSDGTTGGETAAMNEWIRSAARARLAGPTRNPEEELR